MKTCFGLGGIVVLGQGVADYLLQGGLRCWYDDDVRMRPNSLCDQRDMAQGIYALRGPRGDWLE